MSTKKNSLKSELKKNKSVSGKKSVKSKVGIVALKNKIASLEKKIEKINDKNIRLLAEFDNFKRRTIDEKSHLIHYSGEDLILSLLPILDDIQRTVENIDMVDGKSLKEAVNLIYSKFNKILNDNNINSFVSIGKKFDPESHEALMSEKGNQDNVVLKEFERGYKYHDRIIRYAKVVVSKKSK